MKFLRIILLLSFPLYFISCRTQKPPPYYLDRVTDTTKKSRVLVPELRVQKGDLLSIQVYSTSTLTDVDVDALYNLKQTAGGTSAISGFLVDANGDIEYPRLGTIHAEGLTKKELGGVIKTKLTKPVELLKDPTVIIRFLNFKITILGNVAREGVITMPVEKVTILEAIGLAGGISDYGKRDRVKIIREINDQREIGYVDLTSDSLFASPYYNLAQNDLVIVEPNGRRQRDEEQVRATQKISFALTIVTVAATLYNIFKN